jgi:hypothetical protein
LIEEFLGVFLMPSHRRGRALTEIPGSGDATAHLTPLPDTEWLVWRQAVLRATGFPAAGLDRLSAPDLARQADAYREGLLPREQYEDAFAAACVLGAEQVHAIAGDPLLREAVTWQSRSVLPALNGIDRAGPSARRNNKTRERERIVARYWQRYCAKAETIGFFGPVCWVTVDPAAETTTVKAGAGLLRDRRVYLEHWALTALADKIAEQPRVRAWLPPALHPHLSLAAGQVLDPTRPPHALTHTESAVLARCDGRRPAHQIAAEIVAEPTVALRSEDDVYLLLDRLVQAGLVRWNIDLPVRLDCEQVLRERLVGIGDAELRNGALAELDRLAEARDAVAAAAGDPAALAAALDQLEARFTEITGRAATRNAGQMYAGRRTCWEESTRDLNVTIGAPVLRAIAAPMALLLAAARWVSAAMASAYTAALTGLYDELTTELSTPEVPLSQLWFLAQGLFYGTGQRPADAVATDLRRRWAELFRLADQPPGVRRVAFSSADLAPAAARLFQADGPGWSGARLHSPDLQLVADSAEALSRDDFTVVLSEMHVAWATNTCGALVYGHPDPAALREALRADLGAGRLRPLLPTSWPRHSSRLAFALENPDDALLGFTPAPGADPDRLVPISSMTVRAVGDALVAIAADGRQWPLLEAFDRPLAEVAVEAFKLTGTGNHTPRLTVDRLVVAREGWHLTLGDCPLTQVVGESEQFLVARAWRQQLSLPERVFAKIGSETKPVFVDFTSPLYITSFGGMLRAARMSSGDDVRLSISEMLPDVDRAWVPDADGKRYVSELRMQIRDPRPALTTIGAAR